MVPPAAGVWEDALFTGMLDGALQAVDPDAINAVLTGYFASTAQVECAAETIALLKRDNDDVTIVVDPIMGDLGKGLYIAEPVARAIIEHLVPLADLITPNIWELAYLLEMEADELSSPAKVLKALNDMPCERTLVTSIPVSDGITGALYRQTAANGKPAAWLCAHPVNEAEVPNGVGDLTTLAFLCAELNGKAPDKCLTRALSITRNAIEHAIDNGSDSLLISPTLLAADTGQAAITTRLT